MSQFLTLLVATAIMAKALSEPYAQPGEITVTYDHKLVSAEVTQKQLTETFLSKAEADRLAADAVAEKEMQEIVLREAAVQAALKLDQQKRLYEASCAKFKQDCRDDEVKSIDNNFKTANENWVISNKTFVEVSVPTYTKCVEGENNSNKLTAETNSKVRQSTEKCINHGKRVFDEAKSAKQSKCSELSSKWSICNSPKEEAKRSWDNAKVEVKNVEKRLSEANNKLQIIKDAGLKMYEMSCESSDKCSKSWEFTSTKNDIQVIAAELTLAQKRESDANSVYSLLPDCYSQKSELDSCNAELDQFNSCNTWTENVLRNHDEVVSCKLKDWKSQCGSSPVEPQKPSRSDIELAQKAVTNSCLTDAGKRGSQVGEEQKTCDPQPETIETLRTKLGKCEVNCPKPTPKLTAQQACDTLGYCGVAEPKSDISAIIQQNWKALTGALIVFFAAFWFIGSASSEDVPKRAKAAPVDNDSADVDEDESAGSDAPSTANKGSRKRSSTPTKKK